MDDMSRIVAPPIVQLIGTREHPDFRDAVALLRASARLVADARSSPELIVVAQARPGQVPYDEVQQWQRRVPLAGMIALLGSWCEGEMRTGQPWPGIRRLYWYEFPAWWRRQLARRSTGLCPEWATPLDLSAEISEIRCGRVSRGDQQMTNHRLAGGMVIVSAAFYETYAALADVLRSAGYASVWQRTGRRAPVAHGVSAGIWDGGQLEGNEVDQLAAFCRGMADHAAQVVALLDFPRRERVDRARECGAVEVLGKPWRRADLVSTIADFADRRARTQLQRAA